MKLIEKEEMSWSCKSEVLRFFIVVNSKVSLAGATTAKPSFGMTPTLENRTLLYVIVGGMTKECLTGKVQAKLTFGMRLKNLRTWFCMTRLER